jgi:hypothetical protein
MDGGDEDHKSAGHADKCPGPFRRTDCEHGQTTVRAPLCSPWRQRAPGKWGELGSSAAVGLERASPRCCC